VTKELVSKDLLTVLHSLPIEALGLCSVSYGTTRADGSAVNSISIVLKVRYVACGLLDAGESSETGPSVDHLDPINSGRAENALRESGRRDGWIDADNIVDFVDILAKLDKINRITEGW
jgi:hypothetical protein